MTPNSITTREGLPPEMQSLLRKYPRDAWPENPNFARFIRNWMGAHTMFRQLGEIARTETALYLEKGRDAEDYAERLSEFGNLLVRNLHGHHTWEDHKFFPELAAADRRFTDGLEMLETDHVTLDATLTRFTEQSNRVLKLLQLDEPQAREEAKGLRDTAEGIESLLARHLSDEEDLVVPILLHHKLRG